MSRTLHIQYRTAEDGPWYDEPALCMANSEQSFALARLLARIQEQIGHLDALVEQAVQAGIGVHGTLLAQAAAESLDASPIRRLPKSSANTLLAMEPYSFYEMGRRRWATPRGCGGKA